MKNDGDAADAARVLTPCEVAAGWRNPDGYIIVWFEGRKVRAHRRAWEAANGPIPAGMKVLHRCDNRACRNLGHLFLGTDADNVRDKVSKGRQSRLPGERNPCAKLTAYEVASIRALLGNVSMSELGRRFGVDWTTIRSIRDGETWSTTR